jgi:hypothetical protein
MWPFSTVPRKRDAADKREPNSAASVPKRTWQMLHVEPSLACNLACVMCPWQEEKGRFDRSGVMEPSM